jgi:hypothetical protein
VTIFLDLQMSTKYDQLMKAALVLTSLLALAGWMQSNPGVRALISDVSDRVTQSPSDACLAGVPPDPYTDGASEEVLNACTTAVERDPGNADLRLAKAKVSLSMRMAQAEEEFQKAAAGGVCEAWSYLGDGAWHGRNDTAAALPLYQRAHACGDARAKKELLTDEFISRSAYPELLRALMLGDVATLNNPRFNSGSYIVGLLDALGEEYHGPEMSPDWAARYNRAGAVYYAVQEAERGNANNSIEAFLYEKALPLIYRVLFPALGGQALELRRESMRKAGRADMVRIAAEYKVGALGPHLVFTAGVDGFAQAPRSLWDWMKEKYPEIRGMDDLRLLLRGPETR